MYYIGIDISKFKHDCAVIDGDGVTVTPSWSFYCDREGFDQLKHLLNSLEGEKRIGFEATGHYGETLKLYLESNGFTFMEFNPLLVSHCLQNKQSVKFSINSAFFIEMCYNKCKKIIKSNKKACT